MSLFTDTPDEYGEWAIDDGDPTPYQLLCEQARQDRLLQQQVRKYGDAEMRKGVTVPIGNAEMPVEGYVRSYELKMPGQKCQKKKEIDPCARLIRAMKVGSLADATKRTGKKLSPTTAKDDRQAWRTETGEQSEGIAL